MHNLSCAICQNDISPPELYRPGDCNPNHVYHLNCINTWVAHKLESIDGPTCPICKGWVGLGNLEASSFMDSQNQEREINIDPDFWVSLDEDKKGQLANFIRGQNPYKHRINHAKYLFSKKYESMPDIKRYQNPDLFEWLIEQDWPEDHLWRKLVNKEVLLRQRDMLRTSSGIELIDAKVDRDLEDFNKKKEEAHFQKLLAAAEVRLQIHGRRIAAAAKPIQPIPSVDDPLYLMYARGDIQNDEYVKLYNDRLKGLIDVVPDLNQEVFKRSYTTSSSTDPVLKRSYTTSSLTDQIRNLPIIDLTQSSDTPVPKKKKIPINIKPSVPYVWEPAPQPSQQMSKRYQSAIDSMHSRVTAQNSQRESDKNFRRRHLEPIYLGNPVSNPVNMYDSSSSSNIRKPKSQTVDLDEFNEFDVIDLT